jgi:hypothetical protein
MSFRKIVSQPSLNYNEKRKLRKTKSESSLVPKKDPILNYNQKKVIVTLKNNTTNIAYSIQDFEFANEILHSKNTLHSLFMMSLLLYTIECDKQKLQRIYFIFTSMCLIKALNF